MIMNVGLLVVLTIAVAYIMIPPMFMNGRYLGLVRERYERILGGTWSRRKNIAYEIAAALIVICFVILLTWLHGK